MRALRFVTAAMFAVALVPFAAGAASAAPPGNDDSPGALAIHLGDQVTQDTTEATTDASDEALNANCGAPATNASVWYKYSPGVKRKVVLDMTASSFSAGAMVFQGVPTADSLIACGPGQVGIRAQAGKTYYLMVFSDTDVNGGNLAMSLTNAPTPHAHVTLAKHGVAFHGGAAEIHGTYSCRHNESFSEVSTHLMQRAGRLKIQAYGGSIVRRCDGKVHHWSTRLVSPVGTYAQGHAVAKVRMIVCGLLECRQDRAKRHIRLAWAPKSNRPWMTHPTHARSAQPRPLLSQQRRWPSS